MQFTVADMSAVLCELLPAARSPAVPLPARIVEMPEFPIGSARFSVSRGTFRLRCPIIVDDDSGEMNIDELQARGFAVAPLRGNCLRGIIDHGSFVIFDPTIAADDGDLVVVALERRWLDSFIASWVNEDRADELEQMYGRAIPNLATKLLKHHLGDHMLCALDGVDKDFAIPLAPHRIVGVVRAVTNPNGDVLYV